VLFASVVFSMEINRRHYFWSKYIHSSLNVSESSPLQLLGASLLQGVTVEDFVQIRNLKNRAQRTTGGHSSWSEMIMKKKVIFPKNIWELVLLI